MAKSLTIRQIETRGDVTYVRVGKHEEEINGGAAGLKRWIRERFDEEQLLALGMACWLARDPDLSNPAMVVGRTITLDLAGKVNYADGVIRIS